MTVLNNIGAYFCLGIIKTKASLWFSLYKNRKLVLSIKKSIFTYKKIISISLLILVAGSIVESHKILVNKYSKELQRSHKEVLTELNQAKKLDGIYLEHLNLKTSGLNYLQKLKNVSSFQKLSELMETAKSESEANTENNKSFEIKSSNTKKTPNSKIDSSSKSKKIITREIEKQVSSVTQQSPKKQEANQTKQRSQVPVERTDGLNFEGKHYDIKYFSGTGHVPVDDSVYQWLDYTEHIHLLAERQSPIGRDIRHLVVGSKITVNSKCYTIYNVVSGVVNDECACGILSKGNPSLTIQSCDTGAEYSTLTIWYASL